MVRYLHTWAWERFLRVTLSALFRKETALLILKKYNSVVVVVVQSLSCVWLFETSWTAAHQASVSFTNSRSLLKFMSIEPVMPSNHVILCCLLLLPQSFSASERASGSFPMSLLFSSGAQSIGAWASVLPMNIQGWFPLGWTGLISLQSKGLSRVFSNTTIRNVLLEKCHRL